MSKVEKWTDTITAVLELGEVDKYAVIGAIGTVSMKDHAKAAAFAAVLMAGTM